MTNLWHPFTQMKNFTSREVKKGEGLFLELDNGQKVMDFVSSWWVNIHGHGNKFIADAIHRQALLLEHALFADFSHKPAQELVKRLEKHLPRNLSRFFFSDDGSTAVEVALKMAYQYWQNKGFKRDYFICFEGGYHGDTFGAMSIGADGYFTAPFSELLFEVKRIPYPFTYEGDEEIEKKEKSALAFLKGMELKRCAAIVLEPLIQGAGGMRMCRPKFLKQLEEVAKEAGVLIIYDEVMTGFGRTGEMFACQKSATRPDIICLSKGLTGGFLPLALTVASDFIYESFLSDCREKTFFHGHSYTASPLGCAAALASLQLLENGFPYKKIDYSYFRDAFFNHPKVEKVRIMGAVAAFDVKSKKRGYLSDIGKKIKEECFMRGLFLRPLGNTIYFMPPYCVTSGEITLACNILREVLELL